MTRGHMTRGHMTAKYDLTDLNLEKPPHEWSQAGWGWFAEMSRIIN